MNLKQNNWTAKEKRVIGEFVQKVRNIFKSRVKRIILYGSRARGDAERDSDYDFLVLLETFDESNQMSLSVLSWQVFHDYNTVLFARTIKSSKFTEDHFFYLYENVCKEGIDL